MTTEIASTAGPQLRSLGRRMIDASLWLMFGSGFGMAFRLATNLLMTRLLAPEMFGVVAIATVVMTGLVLFSDLGLKQCIVRSPRGADPAFLNTAWSIQCLQGTAIWLIAIVVSIAIFCADWLGLAPKDSVYSDARLPFVVAGISFAMVVGGLTSTKMYEASRSLAVGRVARLELISQIFGGLCMVAWAVADRSIWALVVGSIATYSIRTLLSHIWLPGTPNRWHWDKAAVDEIVHVGRWILASSVMGFLVNNGDRLMLGGVLDAHLLGVYAIAYLIFSSVEQLWSTIITEVVYPAISEIARERADQTMRSFHRLYTLVAAGIYMSAGALMVTGATLIRLLYDARYTDAGWMLQLLAVALIALPQRAALYYLLAHGQASALSTTLAVRLVTSFIALPAGFYLFGLPGALGGLVFSHFAPVPMILYFSARAGLFDLRRELAALPAIGLGMAAGMLINWGVEWLR